MRPFSLERRGNEDGVTLILALGFLLAIGLVISAIASLSSSAFTTAYNLGGQRALEANAESAATITIETLRYTYTPLSTSTPAVCMPTAAPIYPSTVGSNRMTAYCTGTSIPGIPASRVIEIAVCQVSNTAVNPPAGVCSHPALTAGVTFDDLPPNAPSVADNCTTSPAPNTCGIAMTINYWDVRTADN